MTEEFKEKLNKEQLLDYQEHREDFLVCGDGPTYRKSRLRSPSNHIHELLVRPPPEAMSATAEHRHELVV